MSRKSKKPRNRIPSPLPENKTAGPAASSQPRWKTAAICAGLAALVFLVFGQTLHFDFINYDDDKNIYEEPAVSNGISLRGIVRAFTHTQVGHWDPLTTLSHMVDCQLYGLHAGGHHFGNVLLQAVTAIFLFLVLKMLTDAVWRSAFVAAAFAIHPLRAESVAWVTERKDVLSGVFFMAAIAAYVFYTRRPQSRSRYWWAVGLFAAGLMAKSMLVTLPLVLLLLDYWPLDRFDKTQGASPRRLLLEKIPFFALSAIASVIQLLANREGIVSTQKLSSAANIANAFVSYTTYIGKTLWPSGLALLYPLPRHGQPLGIILLAIALLAVISAAAIIFRKKHPSLLVGWLWYLGMLVPVIGIVQAGGQSHADRYTYLPQIGLWIAITWLVADWTRDWKYRAPVLGGAAAIILCAFAFLAYRQTAFWRNSITIWERTIACTGDNSIAQYNMGNAVLHLGDMDGAIAHYREALRINPTDPDSHTNLGVLLSQRGKPREAMAEYDAALESDPRHADAHKNLAVLLFAQGRVQEAIAHYEESLRINPSSADAHNGYGYVLQQQGRINDAAAQYGEAIQINPAYPDAHYLLGNIFFQQGRLADASAELEQAVKLQPGNANFENSLAWFLAASPERSLRNGARALDLATKASRAANDNDPVFLRTLAAAWAELGRYPDAVRIGRAALQQAEAQSNAGLVRALREEISLYESGRAR